MLYTNLSHMSERGPNPITNSMTDKERLQRTSGAADKNAMEEARLLNDAVRLNGAPNIDGLSPDTKQAIKDYRESLDRSEPVPDTNLPN
jgi:hypothetical protein